MLRFFAKRRLNLIDMIGIWLGFVIFAFGHLWIALASVLVTTLISVLAEAALEERH